MSEKKRKKEEKTRSKREKREEGAETWADAPDSISCTARRAVTTAVGQLSVISLLSHGLVLSQQTHN